MMLRPFGTVLNEKTNIEVYWKHALGEPPFGHAEERSLSYFIKRSGKDKDLILEKIKDKGIIVNDVNESLLKIANDNNISPQIIYELIGEKTQKSKVKHKPSGHGRKTLQELSDEGYIKIDNAIKILKTKDIDAQPDMRIRIIANGLGITPVELFELISD